MRCPDKITMVLSSLFASLPIRRGSECAVCMASSLPWRDTTVGGVPKRPNEMAQDACQMSASKVSETINELSSEEGRVCLSSKAEISHPEFHHHDSVAPLIKAPLSLNCRSCKPFFLKSKCTMLRAIPSAMILHHRRS